MGRKIQIMFLTIENMKNFDLSFCATAWDGEKYISLEEELTKNMVGYIMNNHGGERMKKYNERGFIIAENL